MTVLDTSENNLAELVRSIRGRPEGFTGELRVEPLDYGSPLAARYLADIPRHDLVLSFAALKHVRSERDAYSALRLLEVNLLAAHRFLDAVAEAGHGEAGVFLVSTDKAANPVSLMGASKRLMEWLLWAHRDGSLGPPLQRATTTRFANVAFSDGSLPWAFLQRLAKGQPLAAPRDVRRFLVSPREAGELCVLAALVAPDRSVLVPRLDPQRDMVTFPSIAEHTLRSMGLEPAWYEDEAEARTAVASERTEGRYPVLLTSADTSGEKPFEEFVAEGERTRDLDLASVAAIDGPPVAAAALRAVLQTIDDAVSGRGSLPEKSDLVEWLGDLVPGLRHLETGTSLDARL